MLVRALQFSTRSKQQNLPWLVKQTVKNLRLLAQNNARAGSYRRSRARYFASLLAGQIVMVTPISFPHFYFFSSPLSATLRDAPPLSERLEQVKLVSDREEGELWGQDCFESSTRPLRL